MQNPPQNNEENKNLQIERESNIRTRHFHVLIKRLARTSFVMSNYSFSANNHTILIQ